MMIDVGPSPRILISRLSAIGDCVHTLPLVSALRERFPQAHIAWLTQPAGAELIQDHPQLDEVIRVARHWYRDFRSTAKIRNQLRSGRYDVTIDPQSLTKSSLLAWLSGAKHRIGFARGQAREISPWFSTLRVVPNKTHVVERNLELLGPLDIKTPKASFGLPVNSMADATVTTFVQWMKWSAFVLINPGAGWDSKLWPHEQYASVARHLMTNHRLPSLVLWAGERELAWAERIVDLADGAAQLAPSTSLPELAAFAVRASFFVGSDTGPLHLAAAMNTPCVGLYGPTRVCDCGPFGDKHQPLQAYYQDGTSRQRRGTDNRAMRAISITAVNAACDRVISAQATTVGQSRVA